MWAATGAGCRARQRTPPGTAHGGAPLGRTVRHGERSGPGGEEDGTSMRSARPGRGAARRPGLLGRESAERSVERGEAGNVLILPQRYGTH